MYATQSLNQTLISFHYNGFFSKKRCCYFIIQKGAHFYNTEASSVIVFKARDLPNYISNYSRLVLCRRKKMEQTFAEGIAKGQGCFNYPGELDQDIEVSYPH